MKYVISGTDREGSNTLKLSRYIQSIYRDLGEEVEIIDLKEMKAHLYHSDLLYGGTTVGMTPYKDKVLKSDGLIVVTPEYNGSMPGILKYFIDHLNFPDSFEFRPVCFVGIGGRFGGLRPVEHLQGVFGYRNAFIYPERVFVTSVGKVVAADGMIQDDFLKNLLIQQARGFQKFTAALSMAQLDANSVLAQKARP